MSATRAVAFTSPTSRPTTKPARLLKRNPLPRWKDDQHDISGCASTRQNCYRGSKSGTAVIPTPPRTLHESSADFVLPLIIVSDPQQATLPLVQYVFRSQFQTDYTVAFASYLMAMAPRLVVHVFAQRWVISGVTRGAVT